MRTHAKRSVLLLLTAVLIIGSLGIAPAAAAPQLGKITISVSNHYPYQNSNVSVTSRVYDTSGHLIPGVKITHRFYYKTSTPTVYKDSNRLGYCWFSRYISGATAGYKVIVKATATSGGVTKSASTWFIPKKRPTSSSPSGGTTTVYITESGAKYHRGTCRYLWHSKIAISLANAKAQGYDACSVCF